MLLGQAVKYVANIPHSLIRPARGGGEGRENGMGSDSSWSEKLTGSSLFCIQGEIEGMELD